MARVKRGILKTKKRNALKAATKGYRWSRNSKRRMMQEAVYHAWRHAYRGRKEKKRTSRALWQIKMNAALRERGLTYSVFMGKLKKTKIGLDRKSLAALAMDHPEVFSKVVEEVTK